MKIIKTTMVLLSALVGGVYLLNPTFGALELIPDNFPIIGNLDEAAATALVINCFLYFRRSKRENERKRKPVNNEHDNPPPPTH